MIDPVANNEPRDLFGHAGSNRNPTRFSSVVRSVQAFPNFTRIWIFRKTKGVRVVEIDSQTRTRRRKEAVRIERAQSLFHKM